MRCTPLAERARERTPADAAGPLAGVVVAVTRPRAQAGGLVRRIEAEGARVIRFPTIDIAPPADPAVPRALIARLDGFDLSIFVSANAVARGLALVRERGAWPPSLRVAAIGRATAEALGAAGLRDVIVPRERFDSDALLALPALSAACVRDRRIVIFRGAGGRERLAAALAARGAQVEHAVVYRRVRPDRDANVIAGPGRRGEVAVVVVTSAEALHNLFEMLAPEDLGWLRSARYVVPSERVAEEAIALGVARPPRVAERADEASLAAAVRRAVSP